MSSALNSVFGGGNILNIAMSVAGVAFPPLGIATSLANMVTQAVGGAVTDAAQQLCKEAGMPSFVKDIIGDVVKNVCGGLQQPSDSRCDDRCHSHGGVQDTIRDLRDQLMKTLVDECKEEFQKDAKAGGKGKKGGGSWLEALSRAMGEVAGSKAAKMVELSNRLTELSGDSSKEAAAEMTAVSNELSGTGKMFSLLQDAFNNAVKSIGEGLATAARKQ